MTSSFVGYCACSCSPPCCRGPVGDVKLVCLASWRKREYLTFIQSGLLRLATKILQIIVRKLSLFSLSHISSSISKLCHLNLLHLSCFYVSCHRVKIQLGKQPTVSELYMNEAKCRGSWVMGRGRGSWVWVWVNVVGIEKK